MVNRIADIFRYDMRTKFASALKKDLVGLNRQIEKFAKGLEANFGNPADAEKEFSRVAALMREELLVAYDSNVADKKIVPSYREGAGRYAGGALRRALQDPSMAVGTADGITFLNRTLLDAEAAHWRRLNFGAQGFGVSTNFNFRAPVFFDQRVLFYVGSEAGLRPGFALPPGRWIDGRSGQRVPYAQMNGEGPSHSIDQFFPGADPWQHSTSTGGGSVRHQTRGIVPRHFIDAGFRVMAKEFGPALTELFRLWSDNALEGFHPEPVTARAE